jgi:dolichyl-phosphate-mannose--protein O-mannosyl transferase
MLRWGYEDNRSYMFIVHPPLGKWLIAGGEWIFGDNSFGWRFGPAVAGVLTVVIVTRLARRMFRSTLFGAIAGVLITLDGLSLVLARTALLDVFLELFVVASFAALVVDRDRMRTRLAAMITAGVDLGTSVPTLGPRPWRLLAGVLLGGACAVKWTGAYFFVAFVLLSLVWDRAAFRAAGAKRPSTTTLRRSVLPALGSLLVVPMATYLLTYIGWFAGENAWGRHWADTHDASATLHLFWIDIPWTWAWVPDPVRSLGAWTLDAYRFHVHLTSGHAYGSKPWSWLVDGRPVDFYYDGDSTSCGATSCSREVLLLGTPLLWWSFIPMLLWLGWHWITTRDWRAGAIWVAFIAGWLLWFVDLDRTMFFFYMAPLVPFLVLGVTLALGKLLGPAIGFYEDRLQRNTAVRRRRWGIAAVSTYLGLVAICFAFFWPVWTGGLLTYDQWNLRMWLPSWV